MRILVTGANGFTGSWMTRHLVEKGYDVTVLHRENSDLSELKGLKIRHLIGDVTRLESLNSAFKNIDHVFHLAGVIGYKRSQRALMQKVNVEGTKNVIEACVKNKIQRLVHFSSVVAVGAGFNKNQVLNEDSEFNIHHLNLGYFETKREAERHVMTAAKNGLLDAVIVNPSTIYGPGDAKKSSRKTQLKVARGEFKVYTSGGVNIISIRDVVKATHEAWVNGKCGERYILAGENITIKELFKTIARLSGVEPPKFYLPNPVVRTLGYVGDQLERFGKKPTLNGETAWTSTLYHWFDNTKAKKYLKLNPIPAEAAIKESVQWAKDCNLI